jgi:hypothetical protein
MTDYPVGSSFDVKFTTRAFATGIPTALVSGAVAAYPDNSTTQLTAGLTLSASFDSVTGLNNIRVVGTVGNGYAAGSTYYLVLTAGTVDSVSVVGEVVGEFTLDRSASAARLPAALVSGRVDASVGAMASGVLTATAIASGAFTAAKFAAGAFDAVWSVATRLLTAGTNIVLAKGTGVTGFNDVSSAQVNAEVVDALSTDAQAEPAGVPAANVSLSAKVNYVFKWMRNQIDVTATKKTFYNDSAVADAEKDLSDDGTTYSESELNAP